MESNISRDHIALEAMKIVLNATIEHKQTLWNKICVLFGGEPVIKHKCTSERMAAAIAYRYADAMLEERMKDRSLQKEHPESNDEVE